MGRIPLRDIPNAPQIVPQPTGGNLGGVNLGRAQSLLQQETIHPESFSGPGRGLQSLAQGLSSAAGTVSEIALRVQKERDDNSEIALRVQKERDDNYIFRARTAMEVAMSEAKAKIESNPFDYTRYGEITTSHIDRAMESFLKENKDISQAARERLAVEHEATRRIAFAGAQTQGLKRMRDENRMATTERVSRFLEQGDSEDAVALIREQRGGDRFTNAELDALERDAWRKGDEYQVHLLMGTDPEKAAKLAFDEAETPHLTPLGRIQLKTQAQAKGRSLDAEAMRRIAELRDNGDSIEDAKKVAEERPGFWAKNGKAIEKMFSGPPNQAQERADFVDIMGELANLDPDDPGAASDFSFRIEASLTGKRKELAGSRLSRMANRQRKPSDIALGRLNQIISKSLKFGVFGRYDKKLIEKDTKEGRAERGKYLAASFKASHLMEDLDEWAKANPTADLDKMTAWMQAHAVRAGYVEPPKKDEPGFLAWLVGHTPINRPAEPEFWHRTEFAEDEDKKIKNAADAYMPLPKP